MNLKEIKNGSFYFSLKRKELVRARGGLNSSSVIVSAPHSDIAIILKAKDLRIASKEEVEKYKEETERLCI